MKNSLTFFLLCMLYLGQFSCTEENATGVDDITPVAPDLLTFHSISDFEAYMAALDLTIDASVADEYGIMATVLNKDHMVKIGDHLIKVDLTSETVLASNEMYNNLYEDLVTGKAY
ncbi:hypothetical protein FNH22_04970 [Fulvivirga sp. M361]|uniref:hypothetical protein n=1 Tax=Fulvivirga sp. M361 TaxID=2594266 RepID=UPI00117A217D|nr:hypothetical protein [Fulvivirga sp. M361]TRX61410.1 hypothetical protein FNH22_04970 [Fulvivirga sp. M361]